MFKINRRKIGYSLAILVIITAAFAILIRMSMPYFLERYQQQIENAVSNAIGKQVAIGKMEAGWYWYRPLIKFSNVVISEPENSQNSQESLTIKQIGLAIKPLSSLRSKQVQPSLIYASGAHIKIEELADGIFAVEGFGQIESSGIQNLQDVQDSQGNHENELKLEQGLSERLTNQDIILKDFSVDWFSKTGDTISVRDLNLRLKSSRKYLRFSGGAKIDQAVSSSINFNGITKNDFEDANIYLDVANLQVNQWLQGYDWQGLEVKNGLVSTRLWLSFRDKKVVSARSIFDLNGIDLSGVSEDHSQYLHHLSGQLYGERKGNSWKLQGDKIDLEIGDVSWQNNYFSYDSEMTENGEEHHFFINQFNIGLILPYLDHSQVLPEQLQDKMLVFDPHGDFSNVQLTYLDNGKNDSWEVKAQFERVGWKKWDKIPGVEGLTGSVELNPQQGSLQLDSQQSLLEFDKLFASPIYVDALSGVLNWRKDDSGWLLQADQIEAENGDAAVQGIFSMEIPADKSSPSINIEAHADVHNLTQGQYFIPTKILPENLNDWLGQALLHGGQAKSTFLFRGKVADYPFDSHEGVFIVDTDITGLDFNYFKDWPVVKRMDAKLVFDKRDMYALAKSGSLQGTPVSNIEVTIPDIGKGKETLGIEGLVHGDSMNGINYMRNTPLIEVLPVFNMLDVKGPMALNLAIKIPLYSTEDPVDLAGSVFLTNNDAALPQWNIETKQTNGELYFNQTGVVKSQFHTNFLGYPTEFSVKSGQNSADQGGDEFTQVDITGHTEIQALSEQFSLPLANDAHGETDYQAQVKIYREDSNLANELSLSSNLEGVGINFPQPLGKDAGEIADFYLLAQFTDDQDLKLQFNLADQWSAYLLLNSLDPGYELEKGEIRVGGGKALVPQDPGLSIIGSAPSLSLEQWYAYLQNDRDKDNQDAGSLNNDRLQETEFDTLVQFIGLRVGQVHLLGQQFDNVDFNALREHDAWDISVDSENVSGNVHLTEEQVEAKLDKLYLQETTSEQGQQQQSTDGSITPDSLLSFDIHVTDFRVQGRPLGQLTLLTHPEDDQVVIDTISLLSPDYSISAQGQWDVIDQQDYTQLNGSMVIDNVENILQIWDLPPQFSSRSGQIDFNITWDDTPNGFAIDKLDGGVNFTFRYGHITDLDRMTEGKIGIAKVFTLFNLSTLPRRLQLDFSDLSSSGYSFDIFQGDLDIEDGKAKVNEAFLEGPIAYISIEGDVGIAEKDYDLALKIVPHVTSSLPIVATVLGGPIVGAVTFVADKVVDYSFREVSPYNYSVTGSWEAPDIEAVEEDELDH